MGSNRYEGKQPASAIPPHMRLLTSVSRREVLDSPNLMNNSARSTAFTISEVKPFRVPVRTFGSPSKSNSKSFQRYREVVQCPLRQKHKQKTIRLNSPSPLKPVTPSELDDLVKEVRRLALADAQIQASFPGEDDFHISIAAAPYRSSTLFGTPSPILWPLDGKLAKKTEAIVDFQTDAASSASGSDPPTSSHSWSDDMLTKNDETPGGLSPPPVFHPADSLPDTSGNPVSPCSPLPRPTIRTTPALNPGVVAVPTTKSATDSLSTSRPDLTTISVSLVYDMFASPDNKADEGQARYPVRRMALDLSVSATGPGLTFEATVEV